MSENQNRGSIDFAQYDSMATEKLEEILRLDAEMPEGQESDIDKILYIMEVLAERKTNNSHTGNSALEAYESFKKNYMPETDNTIIPIKTKNRLPRLVRRLAAAAAVLVLLIAGSATAKAFGCNLWQAVIQWTQETFHFGNWGNSDPNNNRDYSSFQEALEQGNVPVWFIPTYMPEGFALMDITVEQTPMRKIYTAVYTNEEDVLRITVQDYLNEDPYFVEQSEGLVEEYKSDGITYYIYTDVDLMKASWINGSYECSVFGDVTIEDLKMMINSIKKG